ncbi:MULTISPECIES: hypothetical protein [Pyrobaculum]|uniref:CobQ/CobB/MinD/ParA nucleotide binding domain-containing protein n=2 Tax=Pyrobaculum arsenaticum TaxID=121277 RepID=A4WM42_PYRAR|nr:conserved hypothetical protein [Pyrobaculum arsenaticum DSM 13514]MCY0890935.1 hypothetical protein [Pyrobaculum arsenaticum]NYR16573.1 hypothetical protein [Pyrobaculum arsenaticum]
MKICITSGYKGGTGKSTFSEILVYVWRVLGLRAEAIRPFDKGGGVSVVDFPAFQLTDRRHLAELINCNYLVYVVDEDPQTLEAIEKIHVLMKKEVLGVLINKVIGKPSKEFLKAYRRLGHVHVARFDEKLAVHRATGMAPYKVRSVAVLDMAKAAVRLYEEVTRLKRL